MWRCWFLFLCAAETGRLFVFGSNDWGQLGLGHKNHISKPSCVKILKPEKVTHVACGRAHTLICTGAQKIFACGSNQEGQLGRESSAIGDSSSSPILVYDCGLAGPRIVQIAAGSHHSMALTSNGEVIAWGSNLEGQLGLSGISGLMNKPTRVPIPEPVKEISAGYYHSAFLTEAGLVYVCGESESGKLGIDVSFSAQIAPRQMQLPATAVHVVCGGHHTLVLAENGDIYCAGSNASGQLGMGTSVGEIHTAKLLPRGSLRDEKVVKIACGESHSAILTESGKLFTCGDGRHGKLGLEENENNVHEITLAARYQELFVLNVACGGCHTILVGRRHEINYQPQQQADSVEQEKSSLPPLKLPVSMQNERTRDETGSRDKIDEVSKGDDDQSSVENAPGERVVQLAPEESSAIAASSKEDAQSPDLKTEETQPSDDQNQPADQEEEGTQIDEESGGSRKGSQDNDESAESKEAEMVQEVQDNAEEVTATMKSQQETPTSPIAPPKPPRLKSPSADDITKSSEAKGSSREDDESEKGKDEEETNKGRTEAAERSTSANSQSAAERSAKITESLLEEAEEHAEECAEKPEETKVDSTQDDADVMQSPAPRTAAKMAKLFKGKRQQDVENGTKRTGSITNLKAKSKTCALL